MAIYKQSKRQDAILEYVKEHPYCFQTDVVKNFVKRFNYTSITTAKVCISRLLKKLESNGKICRKRIRNNEIVGGSIPRNVWYVKEEE